ncbi:hypothetical protein K4L44_11915 [Halosquirtibacter laminarini]|uniref:Uncharacterized protein n=1 Tax=Halosquirtibacter laminarini TaxID=3374600 RepID=A0AC61NIW0_9BACT|nr:hypothetical protein K4L44_11915 [Prolixibacteraceae bacterium]
MLYQSIPITVIEHVFRKRALPSFQTYCHFLFLGKKQILLDQKTITEATTSLQISYATLKRRISSLIKIRFIVKDTSGNCYKIRSLKEIQNSLSNSNATRALVWVKSYDIFNLKTICKAALLYNIAFKRYLVEQQIYHNQNPKKIIQKLCVKDNILNTTVVSLAIFCVPTSYFAKALKTTEVQIYRIRQEAATIKLLSFKNAYQKLNISAEELASFKSNSVELPHIFTTNRKSILKETATITFNLKLKP